MFTSEFDHFDRLSMFYSEWRQTSQFSSFLLRSAYAIWFKIWQWLKLLNSLIVINKKHLQIIFTFKFDHFDWLSQLYSEWRQTSKLVNLKVSAKVQVCVLVKFWKWLKFLSSFPFIKKTLVNHVYIRIWSSWLTFTVLQWMKTNFKIIQFSIFLLKSRYVIYVKIWQWLKLLNSFPIIKETLPNHAYIRIWFFFLTFTVLQGMKKNSKISQFSNFLLRSGCAI